MRPSMFFLIQHYQYPWYAEYTKGLSERWWLHKSPVETKYGYELWCGVMAIFICSQLLDLESDHELVGQIHVVPELDDRNH